MMEPHALAVLEQWNELWTWPDTRRMLDSRKSDSKLWAITPKFLYHLILESQGLGGEVLSQFWKQVGACDEKLRENVECLRKEKFVSAKESVETLSRGLDLERVDFQPVVNMTAEYFTHLGIPIMYPGTRSGFDTEFSVSEVVGEETDELLRQAKEEKDFGIRKHGILKELAFRRDGGTCLLTGCEFAPYDEDGVDPELTHIIPNSIHSKDLTLKCMSMFAGVDATDNIVSNLNDIGNAMNIQWDARVSYDKMKWGIEATEEGRKVKYCFRTVPTNPNNRVPMPICLKEGEEVQFGKGPEENMVINGPTPRLCNIRLAVARVMRMSGAADIILEWKREADDEGCGPLFIASEEYCDMLDAKLLLSGRASVT